MSHPHRPDNAYLVICGSADDGIRRRLSDDLERLIGGAMTVRVCDSGTEIIHVLASLTDASTRLPLLIVDYALSDRSGVDLILALQDHPLARLARVVLLVEQSATMEHASHPSAGHGPVHLRLGKPWTPEELADGLRDLLTDYLIHHAPDEMDRFTHVVDVGRLTHAYLSSEYRRQALDSQIRTLRRSFLAEMEMSDDEVEHAMVEGIDQALDHPPRKHFAAGTIILRAGQPVSEIGILIEGHIQLFLTTGSHEVVLHSHSAGRIIGLLSLAQRRKAFYTCRALTDVTMIPLTLEQLETAMERDPRLSVHFVTALIRSLATRNRRMAELQVEVDELNTALARERDQLAETLAQLKQAHLRLVQSEKMATLGQLSAGVAHELNNPISAIDRTADFIREDLHWLLHAHPDRETIASFIDSAWSAPPASTRQEREARRELAPLVGDDALARRLVGIGITRADDYQQCLGGLSRKELERRLPDLERYHHLGRSLRNLRSCARRVTALVNSLRAYSRTDQTTTAHVSLHEGIEDTLLLFGKALRDVSVEREYGELPPIACRIGELNQVWTNLISNALEAMGGTGTLRIITDAPDPDHVRVRISDTGPGIPPEHLHRVFDLNFTTRTGPAHFGLGLGLAICRDIVTQHHGTIEVESRPGHTCFTVTLPVREPDLSSPGEIS